MADLIFYHPDDVCDNQITRVSISVRYCEEWLFVREDSACGWGLISENRSDDETLEECARRISSLWLLSEEIHLKAICPYSEIYRGEQVFGMLFFVSAERIDHPFNEFCNLFSQLPDCLIHSESTRRLFIGTQGWLNMQTNADELWDVYDCDRNLTGKLHRRGDFLKKGEYHLVVHVWLLNSKGEFLLTKRAPNKGFPNTWETSGGAAQAGDDSLTAALREVREETGLLAFAENAERIYSFRREDDFCDVWLIRQDFDLENVILLPGETIDKMYATVTQILEMYQNKELVPYSYLHDFFTEFFLNLKGE